MFKKNLQIILLFIITFGVLQLSYADDKIKIQLKQPPPNKLGTGDLWKLDITNLTRDDIKIVLTGNLSESKEGLIVDGKSKVFTVKPGKSTYGYDDFKSGEVNWKNKSYQEVILRTGNVKEGNYTICVTAFYENGEIADQESCIEQSVQQIGSITLISPEDKAEIDPDTLPGILFTWTPSPKGGPYSLKIVELKGDQSPDVAIKENRPILDKEDIKAAIYQFGLADPKLVVGKKYAWQVSGENIGSQLSTFKILNGEREILIGSTDELVKKIIKQMNNKKMHTELQAFVKKLHADKEQFRLLKKNMVDIDSALSNNGDVGKLSKSFIDKHPDLQRIFIGSGYQGEPGWIIFLICLIFVIHWYF